MAVGQSNYKEAAQLIKSCLKESSHTDTFEYAEYLLLGAEIEYYLENDSQATKYAVMTEDLYNSFGISNQRFPLFGVRLKKILADLKIEAEEYESALKFYKEGLNILDSVSRVLEDDGGEPRRLKAKLLSGISYVELKTGFYNEAIINLKAALEVLEDSEDGGYTKAIILNDLGHVLNEQRSHQQAIIYLKQSSEISEGLGDSRNLAMGQQNLAIAYRGIGDFKTARIFFEKVQDSSVKNNFVDLKAMSLQGIASLYQYNGEHRRVIEILQRVLQETDSPVRRAEILWRLSSSQNQINEKVKARVNANECYEWATANKNENLRYLCATNLGDTYLPNSFAEAEKWFRTAIDITENLSIRVSGDEYGKVYFMQDKASAYHKLINLLVEKKQIAESFAVGEKLKSRVLREKSQNRKSSFLNENGANIPNFPAED
ncbi:MAG: tetratricopeptide repeat protein, partial [Aridibacter sp.]